MEIDKQRPISQPNFGKKIEEVFYKVCREPISVRFLRMRWISELMKKNPTNKAMKEDKWHIQQTNNPDIIGF